ncbi:hypothetical protein [Amedibacillus sp. YH-ame10]
MKKNLLFYNSLNPKQYLQVLLENYPYDIDASMVYSLCNKHPYPHPVLCSFISYYKDVIKIRITSNQQECCPSLLPLFLKMSLLSQKDSGLLRSYPFNFQAVFFVGKHTFSHPYAHLPFQKIPCIDRVVLHDKIKLCMPPYEEIPIHKRTSFIYRDISMDASDYVSISIQITHKQGMIFLSKQCASLAIPLFRMYHTTTPSIHQDFLLIFGLKDQSTCMEYYVDETNDMYIGLAKGDERIHHFLHLKHMLLTLYNALCVHQHDLPIHASMIEFFYQKKQYGFLFAGERCSGKSEMLDACVQVLKKQNMQYQVLFDDFGTLHYLDNEIVSTAIEIGACKALSVPPFQDIFTSYHDGILLEEDTTQYHFILPLVSFEDTIHFHRVTHFFYLDDTKRAAFQEPLESMNDVNRSFFYNAFGCTQESQLIHDLIEEFITMIFVSNIPLYPLYTRATPFQKQTIYKRLANEIFHKILG